MPAFRRFECSDTVVPSTANGSGPGGLTHANRPPGNPGRFSSGSATWTSLAMWVSRIHIAAYAATNASEVWGGTS
jgi:hypothetical protein